MALKDIFTMIKADRYTADGCEEIKKAQKAIKEETADAGLPDGTMRHRKDGDYIKQAGKWVPAKRANGGAKKAEGAKPSAPTQKKEVKPAEVSPSDVATNLDEITRSKGGTKNIGGVKVTYVPGNGYRVTHKAPTGRELTTGYDSIEEAHQAVMFRLNRIKKGEISAIEEGSSAGGAESKPAATTIQFEDAQKAIKNGQVVQWQDRDGKWNDVDPRTSELVMARDIGSKFRIKTDENGNPVKAKPEPSVDETRSKLLELEKRRKMFEKYPDMDNNIRLEQAALLNRAGFESRAEFDDFVKSMPADAAPRVLTGDCKIRLAKDTRPTNGIYHWKSGDYRKEGDKYVKIGPGSGGAGKAPAEKKNFDQRKFGTSPAAKEDAIRANIVAKMTPEQREAVMNGRTLRTVKEGQGVIDITKEDLEFFDKHNAERKPAESTPQFTENDVKRVDKETLRLGDFYATKGPYGAWDVQNKEGAIVVENLDIKGAKKELAKRANAPKGLTGKKKTISYQEMGKGPLYGPVGKDAAPRELTGDCKIRIRKR